MWISSPGCDALWSDLDDEAADNSDRAVYPAAIGDCRVHKSGHVGRVCGLVIAMGIRTTSTPFPLAAVHDHLDEEIKRREDPSRSAYVDSDTPQAPPEMSRFSGLALETSGAQSGQGTALLPVSGLAVALDLARNRPGDSAHHRVWEYQISSAGFTVFVSGSRGKRKQMMWM